MKKRLQFILTLTLLAPSIFAELVWKDTSLTHQVHPLQAAVIFDFYFTNSGVESVSIADLRPGCGCISMRTDKKVYAPGESGDVEVTFKLDKRKGYQRKRIEVRTGGPSAESIYLYVSTEIPQTYAPSVKRLEWSKGEERTAKSCRILNAHKNPYRLLKAESLKDGLKVELKPIR